MSGAGYRLALKCSHYSGGECCTVKVQKGQYYLPRVFGESHLGLSLREDCCFQVNPSADITTPTLRCHWCQAGKTSAEVPVEMGEGLPCTAREVTRPISAILVLSA